MSSVDSVNLYVVNDSVASIPSDVYTFVNDAVAKRWFIEYLRSIPKGIHKDFDLIHIGVFNKSELQLVTASDHCPTKPSRTVMHGSEVPDEI